MISRFAPDPETTLALAVFTSAGCHVCRSLEPSIRVLANDPRVAVASFDEVADAAAWTELEIPGSPFAIALDLEGTVLAKGTFNNLAQLESVLATAERRRAERELAGADRCLSPGARTGSAGRSTRSPATPRGAASSPAPAAALTALTAGGLVAKAVKPGEADAFHFCGHIYTTGSCLHPTGTPADRRPRLPAPRRGRGPGRRPRPQGQRQGPAGRHATARRCATPTAARCRRRPGPRSATRPRASTASSPTSTAAGIAAAGAASASWSTAARNTQKRINGDAALEGYCYRGRKVFCVMYFQTKVPC